MEFVKCNHCGNIVAYVKNKGVRVSCCGEPMKALIPNSEEASVEKHVPVYYRDGKYLVVEVSDVKHPMEEHHYIEWVALVTKHGNQRKILAPNMDPVVRFLVEEEDEVLELYAYCNLHGLWQGKSKE